MQVTKEGYVPQVGDLVEFADHEYVVAYIEWFDGGEEFLAYIVDAWNQEMAHENGLHGDWSINGHEATKLA